MKKNILILITALIILLGATLFIIFRNISIDRAEETETNENRVEEIGGVEVNEELEIDPTDVEFTDVEEAEQATNVREFAIESFTDMVDGRHAPRFNPDRIEVNQGDLVRLKITVTSGRHDFRIDEYNIFVDTENIGEEYVVEFVADQAGEFEFYCGRPGHRENGHWGMLIVDES